MNNPSTYQSSNKKKFIFIGLLAFSIATIVFIYFHTKKTKKDNQAYAKYIEAYTSGTISKKSFIRVRLVNAAQGMKDLGKADSPELFDFSSSISRKTY